MDPANFPMRLKQLRSRANLTQAALAARAGIGQRTISHLEQGQTEPVWSTVLALAKALGVTCDTLAAPPEGDNEPVKPGPGRPRRT
jgi:transcriptional regulator with XRE-family HTH domain